MALGSWVAVIGGVKVPGLDLLADVGVPVFR